MEENAPFAPSTIGFIPATLCHWTTDSKHGPQPIGRINGGQSEEMEPSAL